MENERTENTFWKLISDFEIIIPKLQRDYAQGRNEPSIEQIRKALIDEMFRSLNTGSILTLNFIYGAQEGSLFVPIDGQQRLTTLFLLHWYIFSRSKYQEGLDKLLKGFSYSTRDTSKRFCENIVKSGNQLDFGNSALSGQIQDAFWFVGSVGCDPTVKSMLRVIDDIHSKFFCADIEEMRKKLIADDCPIAFLWLSMDNFKDTNDLYIKMNARGKVLTDFEIFKAKLQSSALIDKILNNPSEEDRIKFISKFNNLFSEVFYSFCEDRYDMSMFGFLRIIIRDEFCSFAAEKGVLQSVYREDFKRFSKMNGSMLYKFIEEGRFESSEYKKCIDSIQVLAKAIEKTYYIFGLFCDNKEQITNSENIKRLSSHHSSDKAMFFTDYTKSNLRNDWIRYALFEYIYRFGYAQTDTQLKAYNMWKRIVHNIVNNTDVSAHTEYICQTMVVIRSLVENIQDQTAEGILDMLNKYNGYTHDGKKLSLWDAGIEYQIKEEIKKAEQMRKSPEWFNAIIEAEEFYKDGQIQFLLDYSLCGNDYDLSRFQEGFAVSKCVFAAEKKVCCDAVLLEKALLCEEDFTSNKTGHLIKQSNSKNSWGFCGSDKFRDLLSNKPEDEKKQKQQIVISLLRRLDPQKSINDQLNAFVNSFDRTLLSGNSLWKKAFIDYEIFGTYVADGVKFYNCIHLNKNNTEVLLLGGTTVRSYSMELNTLILYYDMINKGIQAGSIRRIGQTTGDITRVTSFPIRYLEYKNYKIGYINDSNPHYAVMDKSETVTNVATDQILDYILKL